MYEQSNYFKILYTLQVILALIGMASAAPQWYLADTQEVQEAKRQFAAAYNEAAARAAPPSAVPAGFEDPSQYSPAAEPYVHLDIPAEPYIHEEWTPESEANVAAPAQPAAPAAATPSA